MRVLFLVGLLVSAVSAAPFSRIYVYGDSLSDASFTNGPVAVELLTGRLGLPPAALFNYALGGATTGVGNVLDGGTVTTPSDLGGMTTQLNETVGELDPADALFLVWGGPNDFLGPDPTDTFPEGVAVRAVGNIVRIVERLQDAGAQHILVPGLPNLGLTPFYRGMPGPPAEQAAALSIRFNQLLQDALPPDVIFYNTAALMQEVFDNPGAFGFTNVTEPCLTSAGMCADPGGYLFFDGSHPTTAAHEVLAERFQAAVVPEPGTIVLALGGITALVIARRLGVRRL